MAWLKRRQFVKGTLSLILGILGLQAVQAAEYIALSGSVDQGSGCLGEGPISSRPL